MEPLALAALVDVVAHRSVGDATPMPEGVEPAIGGTAWYLDIGAAGIPHQSAGAVARRAGRVGVLPIRGTILNRLSGMEAMSGGTSFETLTKSFVGMRNASDVKAIVLDIDSPGGSVDGLPEMATLIHESRGSKPIVAQVNVCAASSAYWLAAQADEIAVTPSGDVGSIGVVTVHQDMSAALEKMGIKHTVIASTPFKAEGNPFGPLEEEALASIQADVATFDTMFHDAVAQGRGVKASAVRAEYGQGRMVLADAAVKRGMADRVATMEQTLNRFGVSMLGGSRAAQAPPSTRMAARSFLRRVRLNAQ